MSRTSSIVKDRYNKKAYDEIKIRVFKGNKEIIQNYCKDKGTSVNNLMNNLLSERLTKDGYKLITRKNGNDSNNISHKTAPNNVPFVTVATLDEDDEPLIMPWEE